MTERRYDPDASARTTGGGWRPRRPTEPDLAPAAGRAASRAVAHRAGALLDLQRWAGNQAVAALAGPAGRPRPGVLQRQPAPAGPMTRDRFVETLRSRYGVARVRAGTFAEQQGVNNRPNVAPGGRLTERVWQPWDPGATSDVYESILTAFGDLESAFGGIPPVDELLFFDTAYDVDPATHAVVPVAGVGADFGAGHLSVYRAGVSGGIGTRKGIPVGRSSSTGRYPTVVAGMRGRGSDPGAPIPLPSAAENTGRIITHELGHGVAEQAMAADPAMFTQYRLAVGWVGDELFDIGIPEVRQALAAGVRPPATVQQTRGGRQGTQRTQITRDDWNNPQWIEQPVSEYSVAGGAGEDFAEAVMAFVNTRDVLAARSPARLQFLESHRQSWLRFFRVRPPVGDFPTPSGPERVA
ncbi:hypothetical protein [Microlunatus ginsengisoli]|uniref:Uncharacterized protein n=1 Tax=Microlunatus ginsengisoli TaxID=363863 RepID=A0ABP7AIV8_9ACTN